MKVERTVAIKAAPEAVYEVVMDPTCLEKWVSIHQYLEHEPPGQLREGSTMTQCLRLAGRRFKVRWTVVENDPVRRVVWEGEGPLRSKAKVIYGFEPDGDGTRFSYTNEYELPGGAIGRMAGPMVKRVTAGELDESLRRLTALVE